LSWTENGVYKSWGEGEGIKMDRRDLVQVGLIEHTISSQVNKYIITQKPLAKESSTSI